MILDILKYPNTILKKKAGEVRSVSEIQKLIRDMSDTMYAAPGIGLAAPQVGVALRLAVIDPSPPDRKDLIVIINPEIVSMEGEISIEEGCLSLPGPRALVKRAERVKVRALDSNGHPMEKEAEGLLAIVIQHEIDHLNGRLFIDHLSRLKREAILREYKKGKASPSSQSPPVSL